jgi:signal transduction histidine kinase
VAPCVFGLHVLANLCLAHALPFFGVFLALLVHAYSFGRWAPRRLAGLGWIGVLAFVTTFWVHTPEARGPDDVAFQAAALLMPWLAGWTIQRLHDQRAALDAALAGLAAAEDQRRFTALLEERARIAREMHDVVAHGVSVMVVQAGSARLELPGDADAARQSLLAVEGTGRDVLRELRRTVSLLRAESTETAGPAPSPGLGDLSALVEGMRAAGLRIQLDLPDRLLEGRPCDSGRQLTVYRIVQEGLTNALRHAGRTSVHVEVGDTPDLWVRVTDLGRPGSSPTQDRTRSHPRGGHGLVGMRERVSMYGGAVSAAHQGRGFCLRADIPWEADR